MGSLAESIIFWEYLMAMWNNNGGVQEAVVQVGD
eukprot:CAMPEP_0185794098 /NCGR_PEP_ID=MMETSP1174-20130828/159836_1 /TAXON_ID=35687 /ORGANISM="Dictyocha speculum, Strain CCMP1381" /LENGTH=33 /DNA_ID= /DNA_START= /DNA_END= /DNA_ORIENTATION=